MIKKLLLILAAVLVVSCKQVSTDDAGKWVENDEGYDIYISKPEVNLTVRLKKGEEVKLRYYRNPAINFVGNPDLNTAEGEDASDAQEKIKVSFDKNFITIKLTDKAVNGDYDWLAGETGVGMVYIEMMDDKEEWYGSNSLLVVLAN